MSGFDLRNGMFLDGGPVHLSAVGDIAPPGPGTRAVHLIAGDTGIYRSTALAGVAASNDYLFSGWFKDPSIGPFRPFVVWTDAINGGGFPDATSLNTQIYAYHSVVSQAVFLQDTAGTAYEAYGFTPAPTNNIWHNLIVSGNANHAAGARIRQIVLDGVLLSTTNSGATSGAAFLIDFTFPGISISGDGWFGTDPDTTTMDICEIYINTAESLDLSNPANVAKFYAGGFPVNLGANGSTPTGNPPAFYLSLGASDLVTSFLTDKSGNGNDFLIVGPLTRATTDPF